LALTFDEFGMWLHLGGPYWQRASFDAIIVIAALLGLFSYAPTLERFRPRHWWATGILIVALVLFSLYLARAFRHAAEKYQPVFPFLAFPSGSYEGAIIRDMRLAKALHRRGYKVVIYWMMERNPELVDPGIRQYTLCNGMRFQFARPCGVMDRLGRLLRLMPA